MKVFSKISIVTVNYNGALYLERTIQSVLSQKYPNLEYVIIDGGSTDGSLDIIRKYESQLHYWVSEPDKGMYDALQKGFEKTSGDIMGWINSDDLFHSKAFFRIAELFSDYPQIKWLTGVPTAIDEADNVMVPRAYDYPVWSKLRFYAMDYKWIQQESTVWRRSLWEKIGSKLNTSLKFAGDFDLWLNFFTYEKLYAAPVLIGGFRLCKEGQKSIENIDAYKKEVRMCLRKKVLISSYFLIPLNVIDRALISLPLFRTLYHKTGIRKLLGYPPKIEFNAKTQKLVLK